MSSIDTDVNIILNAEDNASSTVDAATKRINQSFSQMQARNRALTRSWDLQHQSLFKTMNVMRQLGSVANRSLGVFNSLLLMQIRNNTAAKNLRDAIRATNDAYREFGPASREYSDALQNELDIRKENERQVWADNLGFLMQATIITGTLIPAINKLIGRTRLLGKATKSNTSTTTPIGTPSNTATKPQTSGGNKLNVGSGLRNAGNFAKSAIKSTGGAAALTIPMMMGEQTAGDADLPGGFGQLGKIASDLGAPPQVVMTFNIIAKGYSDLERGFNEAIKKSGIFG